MTNCSGQQVPLVTYYRQPKDPLASCANVADESQIRYLALRGREDEELILDIEVGLNRLVLDTHRAAVLIT